MTKHVLQTVPQGDVDTTKWWSDEPETERMTSVLDVSICGSGEGGTGGESTSEAWLRDILEMTEDVGD